MESDDSGSPDSHVTRRRVLQSVGGAGTLAVAGCIGSDGSSSPTEADDGTVTIALSTPESGRYSPIGKHERKGFELAINHLNSGGGLVDVEEFDTLTANGVLGNTVESMIMDSEGDSSTAETNVRQHLEAGDLAMFTGGVSGNVARTHRDLADEYAVPYFVGTSTLDELTGSDCSPHVYRELFNSTTLVRSLIPPIDERTDGTQYFFHVHTDAPEGRDLVNAVNDYVSGSDIQWTPRGSVAVRSGTTNFESALGEAATNRVNIVFLDLFGLDAVNAVQQAQEVLSEDTIIVVPFLTQSVADSLGERVAGIYGTVGWHENLDTPLSNTFSDTYQSEYGGTVGTTSLVPPGPAQNAYGQVLLWASAVEVAGTFDSDALGDTLEGYQYALGAGGEQMRACDHQARRAVPVVRGQAETDSVGNYFELRDGRRNMEPPCDEEPAASCEF
jgi:ABC-type branched-subunit amino acid transport system substrate-binding protein